MSELQVVFSSGAQFDPETGLPVITVTPNFQEAFTSNPIQRHLLVIVTREEEGGYSAYCPEVKGARTQGETIEETLDNMADAITLVLEAKSEYMPFVLTYRMSSR